MRVTSKRTELQPVLVLSTVCCETDVASATSASSSGGRMRGKSRVLASLYAAAAIVYEYHNWQHVLFCFKSNNSNNRNDICRYDLRKLVRRAEVTVSGSLQFARREGSECISGHYLFIL